MESIGILISSSRDLLWLLLISIKTTTDPIYDTMGISTRDLFRSRTLLPFTVSPLVAESFTEVNEAVCTGSIVSLEYTLTLDDESILESNVVTEPMTYMQGVHEIVSWLEALMEGMKKGEASKLSSLQRMAMDRLIPKRSER